MFLKQNRKRTFELIFYFLYRNDLGPKVAKIARDKSHLDPSILSKKANNCDLNTAGTHTSFEQTGPPNNPPRKNSDYGTMANSAASFDSSQ